MSRLERFRGGKVAFWIMVGAVCVGWGLLFGLLVWSLVSSWPGWP